MKAYLQHRAGAAYTNRRGELRPPTMRTEPVDYKEDISKLTNPPVYGRKVTTRFMVKWGGRWRRVYAVRYPDSVEHGYFIATQDGTIAVTLHVEPQ